MAHITLPFCILVIAMTGCDGATQPSDPAESPTVPIIQASEPDPGTSSETLHAAETVAVDFISTLGTLDFSDKHPEVPGDAELSARDQRVAFDALQEFVKARQWTQSFTEIDLFDGQEDSATCYFRSSDGEFLVLMLGYHYDVKEWQIGAYEIPARTFARPEGETFADYVLRSVNAAKAAASPYRPGVTADGSYFIEY